MASAMCPQCAWWVWAFGVLRPSGPVGLTHATPALPLLRAVDHLLGSATNRLPGGAGPWARRSKFLSARFVAAGYVCRGTPVFVGCP